MFNRFRKSSLLFWSLEILILAAILYIFTKLGFIFSPIGVFISTIFLPILISGALYYMLNPIVDLLMKIKFKKFRISRTWAVAIVFLLLIGLLYYASVSFIPRLINQITNLINNVPNFAKTTTATFNDVSNSAWFQNIPVNDYINRAQDYIVNYAQSFLSGLTNSIGKVISMATSAVVMVITVPIILFYMLKDGHKLKPSIENMITPRHRSKTIDLLDKMSKTISRYIGGQVIECIFVWVFTSLGYVLIGQEYALLLGLFAGICNIIPYMGPYIGVIPAIAVALSMNITQVIYVAIVVLIVQQLDGNLVYPNVIGKSLQIHPLTIIVILLAAGNIAGLLGMILAIPLYAVVKVVIQYVYNIWLVQRSERRSRDVKK